jgi:hypothetical protein
MLTLKIITAGAVTTITLALLTPAGLQLMHTVLVGLFA